MRTAIISLMVLSIWACDSGGKSFAQDTIRQDLSSPIAKDLRTSVDTSGQVIVKRFPTPIGYERRDVDTGSFAFYLRHLPLQRDGAEVHYFDGSVKRRHLVHAAVVKMDVGNRDLQQCADAIMRLRGEHLFAQKDYENLHFNFTNGFKADYSKWRAGHKIKVEGNKVNWYATNKKQYSYKSFRQYMNMVFAYAGTLSLEKELQAVNLEELQIGDVFIQGGSPGHAIIVVDIAVNPEDGEKLFLLAQSYMPAQEIHVLQNPQNAKLSPWYSNRFAGRLVTPEWIFDKEDLRRFED